MGNNCLKGESSILPYSFENSFEYMIVEPNIIEEQIFTLNNNSKKKICILMGIGTDQFLKDFICSEQLNEKYQIDSFDNLKEDAKIKIKDKNGNLIIKKNIVFILSYSLIDIGSKLFFQKCIDLLNFNSFKFIKISTDQDKLDTLYYFKREYILSQCLNFKPKKPNKQIKPIPNEILITIFSFTSFFHWKQFALVNKNFYSAVNHQELWKNTFEYYFGKQKIPHFDYKLNFQKKINFNDSLINSSHNYKEKNDLDYVELLLYSKFKK
jgi:hypothetical protein